LSSSSILHLIRNRKKMEKLWSCDASNIKIFEILSCKIIFFYSYISHIFLYTFFLEILFFSFLISF